MEQDFEMLDRERRFKGTKIFFGLVLLFSFLNIVLGYLVVISRFPESSLVFQIFYTLGNALLMPFFLTNTTQIFKRYRNSGSRVRWFFCFTTIMFLVLLNFAIGVGYSFSDLF